MTNKPVETVVRFKVDKASAGDAVKAAQQVKSAVAASEGNLKGVATAASSGAAKIRQMADEAKRLPLPDVEAKIKRAFDPEKIRAFNAEVAALRQEVAGVGAAADVTSASVAGVGGKRRGRSDLSALGVELRHLPAVAIPGAGFSTDALARFIDVLGRVGPAAKVAEVTTSALTPVLGATAASFAGMLAVLAPVAIGVGGLVLLFKDVADRTAAAREATQQGVKGIEEYSQLLATATTKQAKEALDSKQAEVRAAIVARAKIEELLGRGIMVLGRRDNVKDAADIEAYRQEADALLRDLRQMGFDTSKGIDVNVLREKLKELDRTLVESSISGDQLAADIENGAFKANDAAEAERELAERREEAAVKIAALEAQKIAIEEQAAIQSAQIEADRALREEREQEDFDLARETLLEKHNDNLVKIDEQGQDRLADIRERGNDRLASIDKQIADTNDKITEVAKKLAQDRAKVESDAADNRAKAVAKAQADEARALQDFEKRKRDIQRSFNNAALDAEANNDVVALIQAQRAKDEELRQNEEQYADAKAQRAAALAEELAEIEARKQARLVDLQAAAEERRADLLAQLEERQQQRAEVEAEIAAQVAVEKAAIQERKAAAITALNEQIASEDAARKLRLQRQAEDDRVADQRRAYALQQQIADIAKKVAEESRAAGIVASAWVNAAIGAAAQARNALLAGTAVSSSAARSGGGGNASPVAFAAGGIVTRPTLALMGERPGYNEMIVPFRKSDGLPRGMGQQVTVNFNPTITVGDIASMSEVRTTVEAYGNELAMQIVRGLGSARLGV